MHGHVGNGDPFGFPDAQVDQFGLGGQPRPRLMSRSHLLVPNDAVLEAITIAIPWIRSRSSAQPAARGKSKKAALGTRPPF
jgi:hypothetical protein